MLSLNNWEVTTRATRSNKLNSVLVSKWSCVGVDSGLEVPGECWGNDLLVQAKIIEGGPWEQS